MCQSELTERWSWIPRRRGRKQIDDTWAQRLQKQRRSTLRLLKFSYLLCFIWNEITKDNGGCRDNSTLSCIICIQTNTRYEFLWDSLPSSARIHMPNRILVNRGKHIFRGAFSWNPDIMRIIPSFMHPVIIFVVFALVFCGVVNIHTRALHVIIIVYYI